MQPLEISPKAAFDNIMFMTILSELTKNLNGATFGAGVVFGVAVSIAAAVVCSYILKYWKAVLIGCAVVTSAALLMLAI